VKTDQSQSRIGNAFLVFSMLFGIMIALSMTAQAQNSGDRYTQDRNRSDNGDQNRRGRDWDRYGNYGGSSELRRTALNAGFGEGVKQGRKDRCARNNNGYQAQSTYQTGTKDYSSETASYLSATSVRHTNTATPTVTPATSLHNCVSQT
jgi:hypothetical protein